MTNVIQRPHGRKPRKSSKSDNPVSSDGAPTYSPARLQKMDAAFCTALAAAIACGSERMPVALKMRVVERQRELRRCRCGCDLRRGEELTRCGQTCALLQPGGEVRSEFIEASQNRPTRTSLKPNGNGNTPPSDPPQSVLDERQAAHGAPRTLTGVLMGDPAPGRSALARRAQS